MALFTISTYSFIDNKNQLSNEIYDYNKKIIDEIPSFIFHTCRSNVRIIFKRSFSNYIHLFKNMNDRYK